MEQSGGNNNNKDSGNNEDGVMGNVLDLCCGEGAEEEKYGSVYNPTDYDWTNEADKQNRSEEQKIQNLESQLSYKGALTATLEDKNKNNNDNNDEMDTTEDGAPVDGSGRKTIFSRPIILDQDFAPPTFPKTQLQKAFLLEVLKENFLFHDLTPQEKDAFLLAMQPQDFDAGATIIQQGDVGDYFYVVAQGTVDFVKDDQNVGSCHRGGAFGELALLYDSPRAASCVAQTPVSVYKVDQRTFRLMLARHADDHQTDIRELIRSIAVFKDLDDVTLNRFTRAMTPVHFQQGDRIVQKGQVGNVFYIVQKGQVRIHDIGLGDSRIEDQTLRPGDWFGERALLTGEPRAANATAVNADETVLLAMDRQTFERTIGSLRGLLDAEMKKTFLQGLPLFANSNLTEPELRQTVSLMEEVTYPKGTKLAQVGQPYDLKLWVIRHGRLLVIQPTSGKVYDLKSGDHFGDKSMARDDVMHPSSHNAVCEQDLTAWVLTRQQVESVIGDIRRLGRPNQPCEPFGRPKPKPIVFDDLKKHRVLGQGAFGKVWLVEHKETNAVYALKAIGKLRILRAKQQDSVLREKELLSLLDHPFILRLESTFQDEINLYFLLPLIPGGELFSVLHRQKSKGKGLLIPTAAFYSACIIEALGHFHQRSIAYRDLKLENVLIDAKGYCIVVDLGFAKVVSDKTFTLVGTPEYLAPEIIMSKGHNQAVDYWSFGVLCYELIVGVSPFYKRGSSQMDMFKRIVTGKYSVPYYMPELAVDMIGRLLKRREMERLGNLSRGYLDIKAHGWYEENAINFTTVLKREAEAPWIPVVKNPLDSSNFDDFSDVENEVETGRRLKKEEQDLFVNF